MNKNSNTLRKSQAMVNVCIRTGVFTVCVLLSLNTFGNPISTILRKGLDRVSGFFDGTFSTENLKLIYGDRELGPEIVFQLNIQYGRIAKEIFGDNFFDKERFLALWEEDLLFRAFVAERGLKKDRLVALGHNFLIRWIIEINSVGTLPKFARQVDDSLKKASYNPEQISPDDEFWNLAVKATRESVVFKRIFSEIVTEVMENAQVTTRNSGNRRADRDW